jgi:hypothetical protein
MAPMYSEAIEAQAAMLRHVRQISNVAIGDRSREHLYKGALDQYQPALKQMSIALETAAPFYWEGDLCSVLEACAPSMPDWELKLENLPATCGYVLFARPLNLPMPTQEVIEEAIASGARTADVPIDYRLDMVGMAWQVLSDSQCFISTFLKTTWRPAGEPGLMHITEENTSMQAIIDRLRGTHRNGEAYKRFTDQAQPHDALMEQRSELQVRYIAAALDFINQPLLTTRRRMAPDRHTRKRAEREGRPLPDVQVIELRRKEYLKVDEPDEAPSEREYRHRWMVGLATGGYWQRYHTGVGRTGMVRRLVLPYMKLADRTDLPVKRPRETVYLVDR